MPPGHTERMGKRRRGEGECIVWVAVGALLLIGLILLRLATRLSHLF